MQEQILMLQEMAEASLDGLGHGRVEPPEGVTSAISVFTECVTVSVHDG